jgi:hypothetical protein
MDSSLHMHVASLKIQDEIGRASAERRAKHAQQEARDAAVVTVAPRGHWVGLRRLLTPSLRRVS